MENNINKKRSFLKPNRSKLIVISITALTLGIYLSFGLFHIGKFSTVDERRWFYNRVPQYWKAIKKHNWKKTYVHPKPGITVTFISGAGLLEYEKPEKFVSNNKPSVTGNTEKIEGFYAAFRMPILVFNGAFSVFFFWIMRKITGKTWVSLWSSMLILLSPVLIGMSQIVNADSLVWTFSTATLLSFVGYLKNGEKKLAALTSLFLGLSLLTKFISVILLPFLPIMAFAYYLGKDEEWMKKREIFSKKIKDVSLAYLLIIIGSLLVFMFFMPASIKKPEYLYEGTIGYPGIGLILWPLILINALLLIEHFYFKNRFSIAIFAFMSKIWKKYSKITYGILLASFVLVSFNYFSRLDFLNLEAVPFDSYQEAIFYEKSWLMKLLLELRPLVFSITPLVLLSVMYLWGKSFQKKSQEKLLVFSLSAFILVFCAAVIQQDLLNIVRYSIILYPLLAILAALGLESFFENKKISRLVITLGIIFISFISLWKIKPFYLNYSNSLLPKEYIISESWGYGGYEAAQYLNGLPGAENLTVWSDNSGVCEFFKGKCYKSNAKETCRLPEGRDNYDYIVFTYRGETLFFKQQFLCMGKRFFQEVASLYENEKQKPVFELKIDNRPANSIRIFKYQPQN